MSEKGVDVPAAIIQGLANKEVHSGVFSKWLETTLTSSVLSTINGFWGTYFSGSSIEGGVMLQLVKTAIKPKKRMMRI